MNKRLPVLCIYIFIAVSVAGFAHAQSQPTSCFVRAEITSQETTNITGGNNTSAISAGTSLSLTDMDAGDNSLLCAFSLIKWLSNVLFAVVIVVAILLFAYAAFLFVTSADDQRKRDRARKFIAWGVVGLIFATLARLIPAIAQALLVS